MASVFWNAHGVLFIDYLEKGKMINSERYIGQLMRLKNEIGEKRLQMKKKKVLFHHDNVPCHKSFATMAKLNELSFELLPHPPYSPDLAPSDYFADYFVCRPQKNAPRKEILLQSFYKKGIEMLEKRWTDCVAFEGDYVDE